MNHIGIIIIRVQPVVSVAYSATAGLYYTFIRVPITYMAIYNVLHNNI